MADTTKKRKKGSISEEDVSTLLQRYSSQTVLALLQEVAVVSERKIDWNAVVKNTSTGISNPREYQKLWRHLAYRDDLVDSLNNAANPLVLIASGTLNDSHLPNNSTIEAPLTINIPNGEKSTAPSEGSHLASCLQGTNITIPVSVHKQQLATTVTCTGKKQTNVSTSSNLPARRKRKPWSAEEDMELIAAVRKCGERNWANLKGDFKGDRKPSDLSKRWATIRKKQGNLNAGASSQLSETPLAAAHRAMSLALDMPLGDDLRASLNTGGTASNSRAGNSTRPAFVETSSIGVPSLKRPSTNPTQTQGSMAAVADGARIVKTPVAPLHIEAPLSQSSVRTIAGGGSMIKSLTTGLPSQLPGEARQAQVPAAGIVRTVAEATLSSSENVTQENVQKDEAALSTEAKREEIRESQVALVGNRSEEKVEENQASFSGNALKENIQANGASIPSRAPVGPTKDH